MQITFLDADTLDRGNMDYSPFEKIGTVTRHQITSPEETAERLQGADIIITNKVPIRAEHLAHASDLKLVCAAATGVNHLDLDALKAKNIPACNVSDYSTDAVAQHTFAFILTLATSLHQYIPESAKWPESKIFTRLDHPIFELTGRTLGIVGLGAIGSKVAAIAQAFGMKVIALAREGQTNSHIPRLQKNEFFASADIISLHAPLTPETENFLNAETLAHCKKGALIINTSRGALIDEQALADALRSGHIAGAGLDVLSTEPPSPDNPLLDPTVPNLLITPHTAWAARESRHRLVRGLLDNIQGFLDGELPNRVV